MTAFDFHEASDVANIRGNVPEERNPRREYTSMKIKEQWEQAQDRARLAKHKTIPWQLHDWNEEVSRITLETDYGQQVQIKLTAFGLSGGCPEALEISAVGLPEVQFKFGTYRGEMEKLATWLVEAMYLVDSLRVMKEREIRKAERKLADMHEHSRCHQWSKEPKGG